MDKQKTIGERIRMVRVKHKDTQPELAKFLDVSVTTIGNWELRGAVPDGNNLSSILLKYPDINARWLITGEGSIDENPPPGEKEKWEKKCKWYEGIIDDLRNLSELEREKNRDIRKKEEEIL